MRRVQSTLAISGRRSREEAIGSTYPSTNLPWTAPYGCGSVTIDLHPAVRSSIFPLFLFADYAHHSSRIRKLSPAIETADVIEAAAAALRPTGVPMGTVKYVSKHPLNPGHGFLPPDRGCRSLCKQCHRRTRRLQTPELPLPGRFWNRTSELRLRQHSVELPML